MIAVALVMPRGLAVGGSRPRSDHHQGCDKTHEERHRRLVDGDVDKPLSEAPCWRRIGAAWLTFDHNFHRAWQFSVLEHCGGAVCMGPIVQLSRPLLTLYWRLDWDVGCHEAAISSRMHKIA